ncbi:hypothetical protein KAFR_0A07470 [Kazachstania africana CBS 2517]|uniref:Uncharacterized protein n=1 Tax=Kazachstania africana (strain ATCC 22294 / BCRC 22015 / CBS 2517 / CECT 1963 / NBRC 1671 / NRRL Y-8276) TaxID=1071382 RepID=H2AP81_KAZAF|nr:hypothetical protein KAFR_0A07470 [Kazachstania africana CBS 2517]CCF56181.1 hypothetical protein KAFR_0A07470 [Kazachstania africana CBS 2517]
MGRRLFNCCKYNHLNKGKGDIWISQDRKVVEWVIDNTLVRRFTFKDRVIDAGFIDFEKVKDCFVILLSKFAHVYYLSDGNEPTIVCFPFEISKVFWYSQGLILQKRENTLDNDVHYKFITLTDPMAPFGVVSFASNQSDIIRNSQMLLFPENNKFNITVLFDTINNKLHFYYTRVYSSKKRTQEQEENNNKKDYRSVSNANSNITNNNPSSLHLRKISILNNRSISSSSASTTNNNNNNSNNNNNTNSPNNLIFKSTNDSRINSPIFYPSRNFSSNSFGNGTLNNNTNNSIVSPISELNPVIITTTNSTSPTATSTTTNQVQQDVINQSIVTKDVSLVNISSISLPKHIITDRNSPLRDSLIAMPIIREDKEIILILDQESQFCKIWSINLIPKIIDSISFKVYGNSPPDLIELSSLAFNLQKPVNVLPATYFNDSLNDHILIVSPETNEIYLYNPYTELSSPCITLKKISSFKKGSNQKLIKDSLDDTNLLSSLKTIIFYPTTDLTKICFKILYYICSADIFNHFLYLWQFILNEYNTNDEWEALEIILKNLIMIDGSEDTTQNYDYKHLTETVLLKSLKETLYNTPILLPKIIMGLHLVREEFLLNILYVEESFKLKKFLNMAIYEMNWPQSWKNYYSDKRLNYNKINNVENQQFAHPLDEPPSILKSLYSITENSEIPVTQFITFSKLIESATDIDLLITPRSFKTLRLYEMLHSPEFRLEYVMDILTKFNVTNEEINSYPIGIMNPIKNLLRMVESTISKPSPSLNLSLISRSDLERCLNVKRYNRIFSSASASPLTTMNTQAVNLSGRYRKKNPALSKHRDIRSILGDIIKVTSQSHIENPLFNQISQIDYNFNNDQKVNESELIKQNVNLIFPQDQRFKNALSLLTTSVPQKIHFITKETEYAKILAQRKVYAKILTTRICTSGVGYGAIAYSSETPLSTQKWYIPPLNYTVIFPNGFKISQDKKDLDTDLVSWGEFHLGVASGLKISKSAKDITGSWIAYNKPNELNATHGGFLLGLGLNGHLKNLEEWHIYNYLSPKIAFISVGLLLGMTASARGSQDFKLLKVLSVHVVALLPPGSNDLNINTRVQMAALVGVGLILQSSRNRKMNTILCKELNSLLRSQETLISDEGYRISVGIALGLINLGIGSTNVDTEHEAATHANPDQETKLIEKLLSIINTHHDRENKTISENSQIGSIISLTLMFLKSNNCSMASKVRLTVDIEKTTVFNRPEIFMFREFCYNMILWDSINADFDFIFEDIEPEMLHGINTDSLPLYHTLAGRIMAIGIKFASTNNLKTRNHLLSLIDKFLPFYQYPGPNSNSFTNNVDFQLTIKGTNVLVNVLIVAASMVMCATGDLEVFRRVRYLHEVVTGKHSDLYKSSKNSNSDNGVNKSSSFGETNDDMNAGESLQMNDIPEIEGERNEMDADYEDFFGEYIDPSTETESNVKNESHYGKYMATSMAIGFLFLGSGQYALKTSDLESVAYLILATLPLYMEPYSVQELKHFWSLSVESRCLIVKNAVTEAAINNVPIEITVKVNGEDMDVEKRKLSTPCLLPDVRDLISLKIKMDKYYPLEITFDDEMSALDFFSNGTVIYIQPKHQYKNTFENMDEIRTVLTNKMDDFEKKESPNEENFTETLYKNLGIKDLTMTELKLELENCNLTGNQSEDYNLEMLCSDTNSGDVIDYEFEIWTKRHHL